jgi:hypothetical protein
VLVHRHGNRDAARVVQDERYFTGFGAALAACDLDADGRDDLVIGAPGWQAPGKDSGRAWVVPGRER